MRTMTCKQLGGACETTFQANTFEEMVAMSKEHGTEMFQANDKGHLKAMEDMKALMSSSDAMQAWFEIKRKAFEDIPED